MLYWSCAALAFHQSEMTREWLPSASYSLGGQAGHREVQPYKGGRISSHFLFGGLRLGKLLQKPINLIASSESTFLCHPLLSPRHSDLCLTHQLLCLASLWVIIYLRSFWSDSTVFQWFTEISGLRVFTFDSQLFFFSFENGLGIDWTEVVLNHYSFLTLLRIVAGQLTKL